MADGYSTAGAVLKTASPILSAIPYVGPIISGIASIGGGLLEQQGAKKQAEQAERMRKDALNTEKQPLRSEFIQKQNMDKMLALQGLPGFNQYNQLVDDATASSMRAIRESSGSGAQTLAAISAANGLANENKMKLMLQNAAAQQNNIKALGDTTWNIGEKQRGLEDIRDTQRAQGLQSAAAMENAATFNKLNATKGIIGGISGAASQIGNNALMVSEADKNRELQAALYGSWANGGAMPNTAVSAAPYGATTGLLNPISYSNQLPQTNPYQVPAMQPAVGIQSAATNPWATWGMSTPTNNSFIGSIGR